MPTSVSWWVLPLGILLLTASAALAVITWTQWQARFDLLKHGLRATGEVIELVAHQGNKGTIWKPKIRFAASSGRTVEFVSDFGSEPSFYEIGDEVAVIYRPGQPMDAIINTPFQQSVRVFMPGLGAWVLLYLGFWCLSVARLIPILPP